jgi:hypothetical protein
MRQRIWWRGVPNSQRIKLMPSVMDENYFENELPAMTKTLCKNAKQMMPAHSPLSF